MIITVEHIANTIKEIQKETGERPQELVLPIEEYFDLVMDLSYETKHTSAPVGQLSLYGVRIAARNEDGEKLTEIRQILGTRGPGRHQIGKWKYYV